MKTLRTLKISPNAPDTNSVWLYGKTARYFNNGAWVAIGESEPYVLPEATVDTLGGVIKVPTPALFSDVNTATTSQIASKVNLIITNCRDAGLFTKPRNLMEESL